VVGDFNGWDPEENRMRPRSNGTWSAVVTLDRDRRYRFRYRSVDGEWFNDDAADGYESNEFDAMNCVVTT
jgi:1,4-alpha-glucan branching enzyme